MQTLQTFWVIHSWTFQHVNGIWQGEYMWRFLSRHTSLPIKTHVSESLLKASPTQVRIRWVATRSSRSSLWTKMIGWQLVYSGHEPYVIWAFWSGRTMGTSTRIPPYLLNLDDPMNYWLWQRRSSTKNACKWYICFCSMRYHSIKTWPLRKALAVSTLHVFSARPQLRNSNHEMGNKCFNSQWSDQVS